MEKFININIEEQLDKSSLSSFKKVYGIYRKPVIKKWLGWSLAIVVLIFFLPWTQNIRARGLVTTLRQEQRPQEINSVIAGRIAKWFIKEGDLVKEGDTLLQLAEVKAEYFDPKLLDRTQDQIKSKQLGINNYQSKATTSEVQARALAESKLLKLQSLQNKLGQQQLKILSDSADLQASKNELLVYKRQIEAARMMLDSGVISLVDFEKRKVNFQNAESKNIMVENKYLQSIQELLNLKIERNSIIQDYTDKISKTEGEKFSALSSAASMAAEIASLENNYANYDARSKFYFIIAPQDGQVIKAGKSGINEMVKEGDMLLEIVPSEPQYAVEVFVKPMDLPLISIGQKFQFVFDGFPAIVFSGWPKSSFGTFGGKVSSIESSAGTNGNFRVIVTEDPKDRGWPTQLKMGSGASAIALLKDVPIYYELWRTINGFPPDYYQTIQSNAIQHAKEK